MRTSLEAHPETRLILLSTPNNPTGAVYTEDQIQELSEIAQNHDAIVIVDQAYRGTQDEGVIFDASTLIKLGEKSNIIVINSVTKAMGLRGLRSSWMVGSTDIIAQLQEAQIGKSSPIYKKILLHALTTIERADTRKLQAARQLLKTTVDDLPNINIIGDPQGGVTVLLKLPHYTDAEELVRRLEKKYKLKVDYGGKFGMEDSVRVSIANIDSSTSQRDLQKALAIISYEAGMPTI